MKTTINQLVRFGVVGIVSNGLIYLLYIAITTAGLEYKLAMTLLYVLAVVQTFIFNKRWSFQHTGSSGNAFSRYCIAYIAGYSINLIALLILVDRFGYTHQIVQGGMILTLACVFFILQKFWIFK